MTIACLLDKIRLMTLLAFVQSDFKCMTVQKHSCASALHIESPRSGNGPFKQTSKICWLRDCNT
uniref:Uncharacterized protein n=1 Tax=Anguilla anguilla TaxID=7936 RepID=A0A0E9UM92_ANGAN